MNHYTSWIDDRDEAARVVIDVTDVGRGARRSKEQQDRESGCHAYTASRPLTQAIQDHADRRSSLKCTTSFTSTA
jgi:hypothetical protein